MGTETLGVMLSRAGKVLKKVPRARFEGRTFP